MKRLVIGLATVLVGVLVAITYFVFEAAVDKSQILIWTNLFNSDQKRWLVIPLALVLGLMFFALQHYLDPKSDQVEAEALGGMPPASLTNLIKVLGLGFLSLVAGATLGPEAVLVPAALIVGGLVARQLKSADKNTASLLSSVAVAALFTAFFNSVIFGFLSVFLLAKIAKTKPTRQLLLLATLGSVVARLVLIPLESRAYTEVPAYTWSLNRQTMFAVPVLALTGYLLILLMNQVEIYITKLHALTHKQAWWLGAVLASAGLALLYLLGGSMVEFTGNAQIVPLFNQAGRLGLTGLLWLAVIKLVAISWSKVMGYRGGLIFPTVFIAASLVAISQLYLPDINLAYGLIAVMFGAIVANKKTGNLF